jgi:hypothetical protein
VHGYVQPTEYYGSGKGRWTALGLSFDGTSHAPIYTGLTTTSVVVGHPVIADASGSSLIIQTTCVGTQASPRWVVQLNNPTTSPITTKLTKGIPIDALFVPSTSVTVAPGGWMVLD